MASLNLNQIGEYLVKTKSYELVLWFNPSTGHWQLYNEEKEDYQEVGYMDIAFEEKIISADFIEEY